MPLGAIIIITPLAATHKQTLLELN